MAENFKELAGFIWSVADLLRGDYKQSEYGKVILPFTVLRRLDCIITAGKDEFLVKYEEQKKRFGTNIPEPVLRSIANGDFYNTSPYTLSALLKDADHLKSNLQKYIEGYSDNVRNIMGNFDIYKQLERLDSANLLYLITQKFAGFDLRPEHIGNIEMGYAFEELIRRFSELSNETAGEHFTPREVIELMVHTLFNGKHEEKHLTDEGKIFKIYDPACGTGGMLSVSDNFLKKLNTRIKTALFGQEINAESYATCTSDMVIKGQEVEHIIYGDTLRNDGLRNERFDYMLCNPPFGVEWKKQERDVTDEHRLQGYNGRFGAGLPRINDGSLLFLQHMLSKIKPVEDGGSRVAIVFNGSPLFTGGAGGGESNIRRWIIENDWLEAVIALPTELFYNTGIATYIWVLTNRKDEDRKGKIQLVNAIGFFEKMRKSLGNKRNRISEAQIDEITAICGKLQEGKFSKVFDNDDFGFERITVERPLRLRFDITEETLAVLQEGKGFQALATSRKKGESGSKEIEAGKALQAKLLEVLRAHLGRQWRDAAKFTKEIKALFKKGDMKLDAKILKLLVTGLGQRDEKAEIVQDKNGNPTPDATLRDNENVPLKENIQEYFTREVLPHVPDAWIDESKTVRGYEIPFTRHFYTYTPPRKLEEIEAEIRTLETEIITLLREVAA